jgi:serine/threonine-protein kinase HipA
MANMNILNVFLHHQHIGTLILLPGERHLFTFNQSYIDNHDRPTLSLSFKDKTGNLMTDIRSTRIQVPPFFSNLLPEGPMRDYLAHLAGKNSNREFFLLWVLGKDLPGAITIEPEDGESWPPLQSNDENHAKLEEHSLRFSLAGVQLKFSALMKPKGGLTIPAQGVGGSWIVKLPSMRFSSIPENEYSMMMLASKLGMDIPEIKLVPLNEIANLPENFVKLQGNALAVKRFDRTENGLVHVEDFAQIFNVYPDRKYDSGSYKNIGEVIGIETGEKGIAEYIRRLVFNSLIGNADMHLKNWSLIYPDKKQAALAPGYDFVSTIAFIEDKTMALKYVKSKYMSELSFDMLKYFASKAKLPEYLVLSTAKETVKNFLELWHEEKQHLPLTKAMITNIEKNFSIITLVQEIHTEDT